MKINDEFKTYQEADQAVTEYFKDNYHTVRVVDSLKNKDSTLIYKYIEWQCVHYGTDDNLVGDSRKRKRVCLISFNCKMGLRIPKKVGYLGEIWVWYLGILGIVPKPKIPKKYQTQIPKNFWVQRSGIMYEYFVKVTF